MSLAFNLGICTRHLVGRYNTYHGRLARGPRWACLDTFSGPQTFDCGAPAETRARARAHTDQLFLPVNAAAGVSTRLTTVSRAPTMLHHRVAFVAAAVVAIVSQMSSGTSLHQSCCT